MLNEKIKELEDKVRLARETLDDIKVKVGQVWKDNDPRIAKRFLTVQSIEKGYAICLVSTTGRTTRIAVERFRPKATGYKLIAKS